MTRRFLTMDLPPDSMTPIRCSWASGERVDLVDDGVQPV